MSSYDPTESKDDGSSHDPGVKEGEVVDQREFSDVLYDLERWEYLMIGALLSVPTAILTAIAVLQLFPGFEETAADLLRSIGISISGLVSGHSDPLIPLKNLF